MAVNGNTCYSPGAAVNMTEASEKHAVRCYSPSADLGFIICDGGGPSMVTFAAAKAACANLTENSVSDFRVPMNVTEAGTACGTGCGVDGWPVWLDMDMMMPGIEQYRSPIDP